MIRSQFHWFSKNSIAVMIVEDHDVLVAATGLDGKTSRLVRVDLSGGFVDVHDVGERVVGAIIRVVGFLLAKSAGLRGGVVDAFR